MEDANAHIQVFEKLFPLSKDFQYTFLSAVDTDGFVLQITVNKTVDIKEIDGKVYLRR
jgi:ATP-dependent DNA helicase RecG